MKHLWISAGRSSAKMWRRDRLEKWRNWTEGTGTDRGEGAGRKGRRGSWMAGAGVTSYSRLLKMRVAAVNIWSDVHASSEGISEAYVEESANGHHRSINILRSDMPWHLHIRAFCLRYSRLNLPEQCNLFPPDQAHRLRLPLIQCNPNLTLLHHTTLSHLPLASLSSFNITSNLSNLALTLQPLSTSPTPLQAPPC